MVLCCRRPSSYVERPRHGSPAELYGTLRPLMRHSGVLLYVPKDRSEPRRQRALPMLYTCSPRG
eukprot:3039193-Prymnesium_polylepis.1